MKHLRILITCQHLHARGGTELYVRDVAVALLRMGHTPIVFASEAGDVAAEIRNLTIPVVDRLEAITIVPDLILGQHHLPTMMTLLQFAGVPAVYVCHDWYGLNAFAPRFPRILRFVAVDVTCRDRLVCEDGIEERRVRLIPTSVDLDRFGLRPPLPARPARALVFGNYTHESPHLNALRTACAKRGIQVDVVGERMNNAVDRPEQILLDYDIVFAKGRAALEALAVGCAVIIYSGIRFLGPMVRAEDVERLLPVNFGIRAMGDALTPEALAVRVDTELARYDPLDARNAATLARASAGQAMAMHTVSELCEEVVAEYEHARAGLDEGREGPAAAAYLQRLLGRHAELIAKEERMWNSASARLSRRLDSMPRIAGPLRSIARALVR